MLMKEAIIWRPILERIVTLSEVKSGVVTLPDLCKICALLDMRHDMEQYYINHPKKQRGDERRWI